jgi:hypothetical protein
MSDLDYFMGEWEIFKKFEHTEHAGIRKDLQDIKQELKILNDFRSKSYGVVAAVGFLTGGSGAALITYLMKMGN